MFKPIQVTLAPSLDMSGGLFFDRLLIPSDSQNPERRDLLTQFAVRKADHHGDCFRGIGNGGLPPLFCRVFEAGRKDKHGGNQFSKSRWLVSNGNLIEIMFAGENQVARPERIPAGLSN
jgi:hypothetical protein